MSPNLLYFGLEKWLATSAFFEEGKFEKLGFIVQMSLESLFEKLDNLL